MSQVIISREANDTINGVRRTGRVYIVGPLWDIDPWHYAKASYSSTEDREKASRFTRELAECMLLSGKWHGSRPEIEEVA